MLNKLTIGKKIGLGFFVVLILLAFIGLLSNRGSLGIVKSFDRILEGNKLVGDLAQKELDHLTWVRKVNQLLTDENVTTLDVQTDDHKCAFGKWLYGEGRKESENLVPELIPLLKRIEGPHRQLHESAVEIGEVFKETHRGLALTLSDRMRDHVNWVSKVGMKLAEEAGGLYSYQAQIKNVVKEAYSIIEAVSKDERLGSLQERKAHALNLIEKLRYGPEGKDYLWINDMDHRMVMHPYNPALNGKDLSDYADPKGKKLFMEFVKVCRESGEGFVDYYWPKYGDEKLVPKLSYVKLFKEWNWVIGTGVYLDDTNQALLDRAKDFAAGKPFSLGVQVDPAKCAFGHFLEDPNTLKISESFPEFKAAIDAVREPHIRLHRTAVEIERLVNGLEIPQAIKILQNDSQAALKDVGMHFNSAMEAEESLARGAAEANRVYSTKTVTALIGIQTLLGEIRKATKERIMEDEARLFSSAQGTRRNVNIVGIAAITLGILFAIFLTRGIVIVLRKITSLISNGAEQVAYASEQVSAASESLAEGTSEQAASLEETSSSLEEMASMTRQNAENAIRADSLMKEANKVVDQATSSMSGLITSMEEISRASEETSKIIKTIDEIAFQTNLLALNAAVEAARAGEAGAGFAVVADEVRNLAMRAAEASRNTTDLINGTVKKVKDGSGMVIETSDAFSKVAERAEKIGELLAEIAASSNEQAQGIDQVNTAVAQMDDVIQENAASAEESASAAEEMNAQAEQMKEIVGELVALVDGRGKSFMRAELSNAERKVEMDSRKAPATSPEGVRSHGSGSGKAEKVSLDQTVSTKDGGFEDF